MYARADSGFLDDLDDAQLVLQFRNGNDEALHVLLRRHSDALYRFCLRLAPTREDAEDICQESLARAIDKVDSLAAGGAFRTWLFRIARNLLTDSFRNRRRLCRLPDEDEATPVPLHEDGPQSRLETDEEHRTVSQAFLRLNESHQRVLMLREVEGLSYHDISQRLNVSHSAVETLLFRARRRLRQEYGRSEKAPTALGVVGGIRALALRLSAPIAGGGPVAAKVAVTAVVIGGTAAAVHGVIQPYVVRHAAARTGARAEIRVSQRGVPAAAKSRSAVRSSVGGATLHRPPGLSGAHGIAHSSAPRRTLVYWRARLSAPVVSHVGVGIGRRPRNAKHSPAAQEKRTGSVEVRVTRQSAPLAISAQQGQRSASSTAQTVAASSVGANPSRSVTRVSSSGGKPAGQAPGRDVTKSDSLTGAGKGAGAASAAKTGTRGAHVSQGRHEDYSGSSRAGGRSEHAFINTSHAAGRNERGSDSAHGVTQHDGGSGSGRSGEKDRPGGGPARDRATDPGQSQAQAGQAQTAAGHGSLNKRHTSSPPSGAESSATPGAAVASSSHGNEGHQGSNSGSVNATGNGSRGSDAGHGSATTGGSQGTDSGQGSAAGSAGQSYQSGPASAQPTAIATAVAVPSVTVAPPEQGKAHGSGAGPVAQPTAVPPGISTAPVAPPTTVVDPAHGRGHKP